MTPQGYLRPLWLPPEEELLLGEGAAPAATGGPAEALPQVDLAPPAYEPPDLLSAPPMGFRERLATALAGAQPAPLGPGASSGESFLSGLLSGGAQGYGRAGVAKQASAERDRQAENAVRRTEADRNYLNASATWRAKLVADYKTKADREGKVLVTKPMAEAMGAPAAAGSYRDPVDVAKTIRERQSVARVPAELAGTLGMAEGAETTPQTILGARQLLKPPKPENVPPPGILSDDQRRGLTGLNTAIRSDPDIKDFVTVRDNYKRMTSMANLASGQGDLSLIFAYMKVLDPTSVVREAEYNNAAQAVGKLPQLANVPREWLAGNKLTPAGRAGFIAAAESLYNAKKVDHDRATKMYGDQARALGVDPSLVLRDYSVTPDSTATTQPRAGYVRIIHSDGTQADFPAGQPIPAGWRKQ